MYIRFFFRDLIEQPCSYSQKHCSGFFSFLFQKTSRKFLMFQYERSILYGFEHSLFVNAVSFILVYFFVKHQIKVGNLVRRSACLDVFVSSIVRRCFHIFLLFS